MLNLNARQELNSDQDLSEIIQDKTEKMQSELEPWDAYITSLEVKPHAVYVGKTLEELQWREKYGINVAYIKRGDKLIHPPGRFNKLMPFDQVGIIATESQMQAFKPVFDVEEPVEPGVASLEEVVLYKIIVDEHNRLKGQTIRGSGVRWLARWTPRSRSPPRHAMC